ncbi:DUF3224 domain-containing protein [Pseudochrobactrum kiredjianiae]|uniref:DUF3224 domain-containing protein n=1 Tax=Pseudochrobactrum kiredjianiae TaxID=386305 RepID=A0ABW3UZY9_9HYPH|nr:DUF3224 domain-containing protein [Pseudochrobactrum kiredjianiae]MDM7852325.1 DUF3224 domain-containing protein [Pseudochrobactrum kiredjianiae]
MKAAATFTTIDFKQTEVLPTPSIKTALPIFVSTMEKLYSGEIQGRSATIFTAAFDHATKKGCYTAMESFEGSVNGKVGTFNFLHTASTTDGDRANEFFYIVSGSGTGDLKTISGTGGMRIDTDGTHHIWLDYQID